LSPDFLKDRFCMNVRAGWQRQSRASWLCVGSCSPRKKYSRICTSRLVAGLLAVGFFSLCTTSWAAVEAVESSVLRLEITSSPYSFRVLEKATGEVLVSQDSTVLTIGAEPYPVSDAGNLVRSPDGVHGDLRLQLAGRNALASGVPDRAEVAFRFLNPQVLQVEISYSPANGISEEFNDQGEHYYGIWEYPFGGNIDNRGADQDFRGLGNERYVHHSSARAPFYLTSRKYGIYVESLASGHYAVAQAGKTSFTFRDSQLKYDIVYGPSYDDVLNRYNAMAGPAFMPPPWAFGTVWWRDDEHEDLRNASNAQEKVIADADQLRALHLPAGAIWLDRPYGSGDHGWGNMDFDNSFPNPSQMIRDLNDRGMKLLLWTANRSSAGLFQEGSAKGFLFPNPWPAADIQRPEVYSWFQDKLNAYVRLGVRGYKIDRGEEGEMPETAENMLSVLFPKLSAEGLRARYGNDYFVFSRNANDTARKYTAVWNGDSWSSFEGLQVSIKTGIRSGLINFPMWGSDTGGYFAPAGKDKDLLARWLEFSAFSPMMEVILGPKRTLWDDYDGKVVDIARQYAALHHDLIPYTRSYMYQATQTGMPIMRALILSYPNEETLTDKWDEYLYGRDLLVAPISTANTSERKVYLPDGLWMNYNDKHTVYQGKSTVAARAPLETIPLFVREGAIVPRGDIVQLNNNWDSNWTPKLHLEVFPARKQASEFDYFTGDGVQKIIVTPGPHEVAIHFGDLGVSGMVLVYCKAVRGVSRNGTSLRQVTDYTYDQQGQTLAVPFEGATTLAIKGGESLFASRTR
jgi:alpha-D-xyloside xylohydrolase